MVWEGLKLRASMPFPRGVTLWAYQCIYQPGSYTEFWCPELLLGPPYLGMVGWIIGHVIELNLWASPLLLEGGAVVFKAPTS